MISEIACRPSSVTSNVGFLKGLVPATEVEKKH
jgi:hypothetical protein